MRYFLLCLLLISGTLNAQTFPPNTQYTMGLKVDAGGVAHYVYFTNQGNNLLGYNNADQSMTAFPMGSGIGQIPLVPIPMSAVPTVKTICDQITGNSNPAAYRDVSFFGTAAQGALASTALQSFAVNTVTGLTAGSTPTVTNVGTGTAVVLNFGIPAGVTGATGSSGTQGQQGVKGDTGTQGIQGTAGATGPAGSQGIQGTAGSSGIIAVTAPITNSGTSTSASLGIVAATSSVPGSMSASDKAKLDAYPGYATRSFNNVPARTIQTVAAAANGWQLSSTRDASISYSVSITTTTSIGGPSSGNVVLEICSTNSATAASWIQVGQVVSSQTATLAIALNLVSINGGGVFCTVPAGYYARLRSTVSGGTVSFAFLSGQEVLE